MTFTEALTAVFHDTDRITRISWRNRNIYLCLSETQLRTTWSTEAGRIDGELHPYVISESDFFADDWEVLTNA